MFVPPVEHFGGVDTTSRVPKWLIMSLMKGFAAVSPIPNKPCALPLEEVVSATE